MSCLCNIFASNFSRRVASTHTQNQTDLYRFFNVHIRTVMCFYISKSTYYFLANFNWFNCGSSRRRRCKVFKRLLIFFDFEVGRDFWWHDGVGYDLLSFLCREVVTPSGWRLELPNWHPSAYFNFCFRNLAICISHSLLNFLLFLLRYNFAHHVLQNKLFINLRMALIKMIGKIGANFTLKPKYSNHILQNEGSRNF